LPPGRANFRKCTSALILRRSCSYSFVSYAEIRQNTVSSPRVSNPRSSSGVRLQGTSIVEAKLSSRGSTSVASMYQTLSYVSKLSSRGSARQCTNFDRDNVAPCLLKRLATPYLLRRLAIPCLLRRLAAPYLLRGLAIPYFVRRLAAPYLLRGLANPYLLRRLHSLVIAFGPEVACHPSYYSGMVVQSKGFLRRHTRLELGFHLVVSIGGIALTGVCFDRRSGFDQRGCSLGRCWVPLEVTRPEMWVLIRRVVWFRPEEIDWRVFGFIRRRSIGWLIRRAIPFHMPWRHPDSCITDKEPHGLDTSILGRVADRTISPALAGAAIPRASPEEVAVTQPGRKAVTKADHVATRKASTRPEISTNATKKTRSSKKGSGAGFSRKVAGDEVEQTDDGTLDDDDQRVSEDVSPRDHEAGPTLDAQPLDVHADVDGFASDGNVDPYYEARVSNTVRDVLERYLIPIVQGPYYISYPYDEELYKDPKVCKTALNRFPTPAETHQLRELSSVELSDRMSVLQCQLITYGSMLNAHYDHSLRNVEHLSKQCAQQTQIIKKQNTDLKQQNESTVRANEEVYRLTAHLRVLKSRCQTDEQKLSGWDKKHRKYRHEKDALVIEKAKIEKELVETKLQLEHHERQAEGIQGSIASFFQSDFTPHVRRFHKSGEFIWVFAGVLNTTISVGVECGLRMDRIDEEFRELSHSLQDLARLEPDRVTPSHQTSCATTSLRANTHARHSTSSSKTFVHTSTLEHLKKKKKPIERGVLQLF
nr:hypothetical protein [Tanacetum cinerariifolium]